MDDFSIYYSKAAALCSRAEKCSSEIAKKLMNWGASEEVATKVLNELIDEKFIDDARFAAAFVKDKFRFNKWGRVKIAYMLRQKGVSSETINQAMLEIDEDDYQETLKKLLLEKAKKTSGSNTYDKKAKLLRFAQSHGFESGDVFKILGEI